MRRHHQAFFFLSAVDIGWDDLPVPVDELGDVGIVEEVHRYRHALVQANERAWNTAVVADGADGVVFGDVDQNGRDAQRYVSRARGRGLVGGAAAIATVQQHAGSQSGDREKITACMHTFSVNPGTVHAFPNFPDSPGLGIL